MKIYTDHKWTIEYSNKITHESYTQIEEMNLLCKRKVDSFPHKLSINLLVFQMSLTWDHLKTKCNSLIQFRHISNNNLFHRESPARSINLIKWWIPIWSDKEAIIIRIEIISIRFQSIVIKGRTLFKQYILRLKVIKKSINKQECNNTNEYLMNK